MAAEDGLKAQKLLAQGIALGNVCKKQSRPERAKALKLKAFALSGRQVYIHKYPGRCPGLGASALSGRVDAKHTLLSGRVDAKHTLLSGRVDAKHTFLSGRIGCDL